MSRPRIGVAGLGLIGGSLALRLAAAGREVRGADPAGAARAGAAAAGIELCATLPELAAASDLVIVAAPPRLVPELVAELLAADPQVLVCDAASVKASVAAGVAALAGPDAARFLPAHPMMGSDRSGFAAADPALLEGALWAVCPQPGAGPEALLALSGVVDELGGRMLVCTPERHDAAVARSSHLPHLLAGAAAAGMTGDGLPLAAALSGGGFRDFSRIARADHALWGQVLAGNAPAVQVAIDELIARLQVARDVLADPASPQLTELWERGHEALDAVDRLRWSEPAWERGELAWPAWDELLALGRVGRTVRRIAAGAGGASITFDAAA